MRMRREGSSLSDESSLWGRALMPGHRKAKEMKSFSSGEEGPDALLPYS